MIQWTERSSRAAEHTNRSFQPSRDPAVVLLCADNIIKLCRAKSTNYVAPHQLLPFKQHQTANLDMPSSPIRYIFTHAHLDTIPFS